MRRSAPPISPPPKIIKHSVKIFHKILGTCPPEEAVFIHRREAAREDHAPPWRDITVVTFDEVLAAAVSDVARFGGCEHGAEEEVVSLFGSDAEKIYAHIEEMLRRYYGANPNVRIIIRHGGPGAAQREVAL